MSAIVLVRDAEAHFLLKLLATLVSSSLFGLVGFLDNDRAVVIRCGGADVGFLGKGREGVGGEKAGIYMSTEERVNAI